MEIIEKSNLYHPTFRGNLHQVSSSQGISAVKSLSDPKANKVALSASPVNWSNTKSFEDIELLSPRELSDRELLEIFPEAKEIIPEKLKEWEEKKEQIKEWIKHYLRLIRSRAKDRVSQTFWREMLKLEVAEELLEVKKQIGRLKRLNSIAKGGRNKKPLSQEKIKRAKSIPIVEVASSFLQLKRSGKNYVALCPFHQEKHPSFYLYPDTNRYYCFSCLKGGDVIDLVKSTRKCSFKDAVSYLIERGRSEKECKM